MNMVTVLGSGQLPINLLDREPLFTAHALFVSEVASQVPDQFIFGG